MEKIKGVDKMGLQDFIARTGGTPAKAPVPAGSGGLDDFINRWKQDSPYKQQIENSETRIQAAGEALPPEENKVSTFEKVLDFIDKPNQWKNKKIMGAMGSDYIPEKAQGSDVMRSLGIGGDEKYSDEILGFLFDVGTDPLNLLTLGTSAAVTGGSKALKVGAKIPFTKIGTSMTIPGSSKLLDVGSKTVKGIGNFASKALPPEIIEMGSNAKKLAGRAFKYGYGVPEEAVQVTRRFLNLSRMDTKDVVDDVVKFTKAWPKDIDNLNLIKNIEAGTIDALPPDMSELATNVRQFFDDAWDQANAQGLITEFTDNYIPHIFRGGSKQEIAEALEQVRRSGIRVKTSTGFAQERTLLKDLVSIYENPKLRAKLKPEIELPKIMAIYKMSLKKAVRAKDMLDELVNLGDDIIIRKGNLTEKHLGWVPSPIIQLKDFYVNPEVSRHLKDVMEPFFNNDTMEKLAKHYDGLLGWWKGMATVPNPGFHIRNEIGNIFNNYLGGVRTIEPYQIAHKIMSGTEGSLSLVPNDPFPLSFRELRDLARRNGVSEVGFFGADVSEAVGKELSRLGGQGIQSFNPLSTKNPLFKNLEKFGKGLEDHSRLAHFVDKLMKGYSVDEAAKSVKKYLFDYTELTPIEKNIFKRAVPFYAWTRNNLPLQISELVKQPKIAGNMAKFQNFMEALSEEATGSEFDKDVLPEYIRRMYSVRLPFQYEGRDIVAGVDVPMRDLNTLTPKEWFSMLTPFATVPIEQIFNKNLFFNREIEEYPGQTIRAPGYLQGLFKLSETLDPNHEWAHTWKGLMGNLGMSVGRDPFTNEQELKINPRAAHVLNQLVFLKNIGKASDFAAGEMKDPFAVSSLATGVGAVSVDPNKAERTAEYLRAKQLQDVITKLRDEGKNVETVREIKKQPPKSGLEGFIQRNTKKQGGP